MSSASSVRTTVADGCPLWETEDRVIAPCRYEFPSLDLLREPGGRAFLNLVERALDKFVQ